MPISDYLKARCDLYRTPVLDLTPVFGLIEKRVIEAWQNNYDPSALVSALTADKKIRDQLASQVEDHLLFKEKEESTRVTDATKTTLAQIKERTNSRINALKESYGQKRADIAGLVEQTAVEHQIGQTKYQQTLDEMESQRQQALDATAKLGGKSALESILSINDEILAESGVQTQYNRSDDDALASTILEVTDKIDPLRKPEQYNQIVYTTEVKTKKKGIFRKMYNFFTGWYRK